MFLSYAQPEDFVNRISYRIRHWNHPPIIDILGEEGRFGEIFFHFENGFTIEYYIYLKDIGAILAAAEEAIRGFTEYYERLKEE